MVSTNKCAYKILITNVLEKYSNYLIKVKFSDPAHGLRYH